MNNSSEDLDDILDDCLRRLANGEGVAACAGRYPDQGDALVPLLQTAAATMKAASSVSYRPEAKARGLRRLAAALADREASRRRRFSWLGWRPLVARPLLMGLVAVALVAGTGFGAGVLSSDSVPGDPLYWVKTKKEDISLMMPKSDMSKAKEHLHLASVRGQEMRELMDRGRFDEAEWLIGRMTGHLNNCAFLVGVTIPTNPIEMPFRPPSSHQDVYELVTRLQRDGAMLRSGFERQLLLVPPSERRRMKQLIGRSELNYRVFITALGSDGPSPRLFWITEPLR